MKEFNISDIKIVKDDSVSQEELLTGEFIKELPTERQNITNSELEGGEYLQFPDGLVQEAKGEEHEDGGILMSLPDGTKVASNNTEIGKRFANKLKKEFDITTKGSDTYAETVKKYTSKIGLKKLNEEQAEFFKALNKEEETGKDSKTSKVNIEYITGKIKAIEDKKKSLEEDRKEFFEVVFEQQEENRKPSEEDNKKVFKTGGIVNSNFLDVCEKHGISPKKGLNILREGGYVVDQYENGDEVNNDNNPEEYVYNYTYKSNVFQDAPKVHQSAEETAYGNEVTAETALQQLYNNFPDLVIDTLGENVEVDETGTLSFKGGISLNKKQDAVLDLQHKMNDRMTASANVIINDESLPEEVRQRARDWIEAERFLKKDEMKTKEDKIRGFDYMLGQYTGGRQGITVDLFTPEDLEKLRKQGITTAKQVTPEVLETLSEVSQKRYKAFKPKLTENADFFLGTFEVEEPTPEPPGEPEKERVLPPEGEIEDNTVVPKKNYPRLFYTPDQSALPPSPMDAHLKGDVRLQRVDPVRIGIETQIQEVANQKNFANKQIQSLPETQRAAVLANIISNSNRTIDQAAVQANQVNAQNLSQTELFNIGQSGQEEVYNLNNDMSFEQRQLTAKAKTEEELRRYYDYNRKVNLNNFKNQQKLNLMNSMFPNYDLGFYGASIDYNPTGPVVEDRSDLLEFYKLMGK